MKFKSPKIIKHLEDQIEQGYSLPIFKGYVAVNKRGVEKLIDTLYETLTMDVINARKYLETQNYEIKSNIPKKQKNTVFDYLKALETCIYESTQLFHCAIINTREIEEILDKISDNLPEEIIKAENLSK